MIKGIGRPRVEISTDLILNAFAEYRSVRAAAQSLNISSGTAWRRLKEARVVPLGLSRSEAGRLGGKCKAIEQLVRNGYSTPAA